MSFTEKYLANSRQRYFQFFATGDGHMQEAFAPKFAFELKDIRIILSVAHTSVTYFTGNLSAGMGSQYDILLCSVLASQLSNDTNQVINPSAAVYQHNDTIQFSMLNSSGVVWGLVVSGWAITQ